MNKKMGFTFVELIVVVTILGILSTVGFLSYTSGLGDARDSTRKSDIASVKSALKQYKQTRGNYPIPSPGNNFNLLVGVNPVAIQGKLDITTTISTLDNIPHDPKDKNLTYSYSTTLNRQEFQLAATLENGDTPLALLDGDYSSVAKYILPTIMLATNVSVDVTSAGNTGRFILNNQYHNLPYDFSGNNIPVTDGTSLITLVDEAVSTNDFWQNTDFRTCSEIENAGKSIGDLDGTGLQNYQLVSVGDGTLVDTPCSF